MTDSIEHDTRPSKAARTIQFDAPPSIGFVMDYYSGSIELIGKIKRTRKDGTDGWLLIWRRSDDILAASGLKSNSLSYPLWLQDVFGGAKHE